MRKDRVMNILKIVKFLEENPNTYLREISRALSLSPGTVHRCLKEIEDFIITTSLADGIDTLIALPNLPVVIRLKEGVNVEGIARFLEMKEKLKILRKNNF